MMSSSDTKKQRSIGNTTVSFSCSVALKKALQEAAAAERRTLSNWVVLKLEQAVRCANTDEQGSK